MLLTLLANNLNRAVASRAPLISGGLAPKFPEILQPQPLVEDIPPPALNLYDGAPVKKAYPPDYLLPNAVILIPSVIPPAGPTPAGRHHKRYAVKLAGRTVYFATRAEAEAARERHREGIILEAKAAGISPTKIKLRRPPIRAIADERHPPELAPAVQMAAHDPRDAERIAIARAMEEEELAIALLLLH